ERLVRQEKLAVLGQLAGGVGHELRNPLGVISNAVYFLQMTLSDADETTREYLNIIGSEVRNSEKIISDLLDFARTRTPERKEIAVSDLVAQVLQKRPPPENVQVTTEIPPDLPSVFVDPRQMGQVLGNLVTNGYQAMPEGGRLTIHVSEGEVTGRPGDDLSATPSPCLRVSISDTGCGIPQENLEMLFEPLFTTKAKGIGLGLAVSKNLVEANGGSIEVESPSTGLPSATLGTSRAGPSTELRAGEEGKGSTFTVTLPTKGALA
ncbi:MAG: ATP-binding protein, partial [Anaerolineae bacterium]